MPFLLRFQVVDVVLDLAQFAQCGGQLSVRWPLMNDRESAVRSRIWNAELVRLVILHGVCEGAVVVFDGFGVVMVFL